MAARVPINTRLLEQILLQDPLFASVFGRSSTVPMLVWDSRGATLLYASPGLAQVAAAVTDPDTGMVNDSTLAKRLAAVAASFSISAPHSTRQERLPLDPSGLTGPMTCLCRFVSLEGRPPVLVTAPKERVADAGFSRSGPEREDKQPNGKSTAGTVRFLWRMDTAGRFTRVSPEWNAIPALARTDIIGKTFADFDIRWLERSRDILKEAFLNLKSWQGVKALWPTGSTGSVSTPQALLIEFSGTPAYAPDGTFTGYSGFGLCRLHNMPTELPAEITPPVAAPVKKTSAAKTADTPPQLSKEDRNTLREIAESLRARLREHEQTSPLPAADEPVPVPLQPEVSAAPQEPLLPPAFTPSESPSPPPQEGAGLLQRVRELEAILDTATDGVVTVNDTGHILSLNNSAEALFGYDRGEVTGESVTVLLAPESHVVILDYLEGLASGGRTSLLNGREVTGRVKQGGSIPLFVTMSSIQDMETRKFCVVIRDLSAFKRVERELTTAREEAERASAMKSDFLAKISHDVRTPLNAILGFTELMLDERFGPVNNARYREYLTDIKDSGAHVLGLINDLLDLARIEAGKMEFTFSPTSLNELMARCITLSTPDADKAHLILRTSFAENSPTVVADERALQRIVLNLLSNAIKYTDAGGQIIVSTSLTELGEAALRIRDTGVGMDEEGIRSALEPFRRLNNRRTKPGSGLGLTVTKALVEAHRGLLHITSRPGQGTLVEVIFPQNRVLTE
ncbi:MAG: PAS domain S-box protein [Methylobacteriaceae bacterium]|jgi:PAS domain S-box-containing protein|nr:PAS domain S-box protein [Methylobacteriaceae bacterium]